MSDAPAGKCLLIKKNLLFNYYPRNRSVRVRKLRKLTSTLHLPELMIFDISFISIINTSHKYNSLLLYKLLKFNYSSPIVSHDRALYQLQVFLTLSLSPLVKYVPRNVRFLLRFVTSRIYSVPSTRGLRESFNVAASRR